MPEPRHDQPDLHMPPSPDAEGAAEPEEETAARLPRGTPQGRTETADEEKDQADRTPGFTPQGRTEP